MLFKHAIAASILLLTGTAAKAADAITIPMSTPQVVTLHDAEADFDWSGFYAGVFAGIHNQPGVETDAAFGIQAGVNAEFDFFLLGGEVSVEGVNGDVGATAHGQILGRAGLIATDDVLVYAAGGYGIDLSEPSDDELLLGGGLELAVAEDLTLETQYLRSFPLDGSDGDNRISFGANFHF